MDVGTSVRQKYCRTLELNKILWQLSELTCCEAARGLAQRITPHTDLHTVKQELQKTQDAFTLCARFGSPSFVHLKEPKELLKIAQVGGMLSPENLLSIARILRQTRTLLEWFKQCKEVKNSLQPHFFALIANRELEKSITQSIQSEDHINDTASPQLLHIRRDMARAQEKAKKSIQDILRSSKHQKALQENIVTMRDGRFVVPVKSEYKSEIPGLLHDTSSSGATLFIEPMAVVEANNQIRILQGREQAEIERILYQLSALCAQDEQNIQRNFEVIIDLNICFAKSYLAEKMNATMPAITNTGELMLNQARHPLIQPQDVVPVNITLGKVFHTLLITGPNTGGKTVTLKTIGLLTLMTMCGLLIPVSQGSIVSVFDHILVDIGDEQSIEQSLSTFSAHMTNMVSILRQADQHSLVLIDELGSGTDPVEGSALAVSILEDLREKGAVVAATTHYPELKLYALETSGVENASCEFDVKTLSPTYRLVVGTPGRSNAFAISRRLGLPAHVLDCAKQRISDEDKMLEVAINRLEDRRQQYEQQCETHQNQLEEYQHRLQSLSEQQRELEQSKQHQIELAREQARKIVQKVTLQAQSLMDELEQLRREKEHQDFGERTLTAKARLRNHLNALGDAADPITSPQEVDYQLPRKLRRGDDVMVMDINKQATLLDDPPPNGNVLVQVGSMKMRVSLDNLRLLQNKPSSPHKKQKPPRNQGSVKTSVTKVSTMELDLRGQTTEEALLETDFFIDKAVLSGIMQITIIHGKGTGALRKAIHTHLKAHQSIQQYRLGAIGEGDTGVTIATLK